MSADGMRGLTTNAGEIEKVVRHSAVGCDQGRARCVSEEVSA